MEFTKEQYREEMYERKANGMDIPSYELWVSYRRAIANVVITIEEAK